MDREAWRWGSLLAVPGGINCGQLLPTLACWSGPWCYLPLWIWFFYKWRPSSRQQSETALPCYVWWAGLPDGVKGPFSVSLLTDPWHFIWEEIGFLLCLRQERMYIWRRSLWKLLCFKFQIPNTTNHLQTLWCSCSDMEISPRTRAGEDAGWSKIVQDVIHGTALLLGSSANAHGQHRCERAALCAVTTWKQKMVTLVEQGVHQDPVLSMVCHCCLAAHWGGAWSTKNSVNSERRVLKLQSS